ncbi:MAG TPA: enoyl-CoA hydratase-related protein [Candidatus Eisenbacteria bacterium]|nr:enoyl-CoA hydratase-related protein [Candidatus Eisenbacteria bacterium]
MTNLIDIEFTHGGRVARLWLNRPEVHNALSGALLDQATQAMRGLGERAEVRAVVIGGRGPSFCAGADLGDMKASANASFEENLAEAKRFGALFDAVTRCPKPVVARVHGNVFGGGVGLTAATDVAIGAVNAVFAISEVRLGIIPGLISPYLLRRLGDRNARPLMLSGERFDGMRAAAIGLLHRAVAPEELDSAIDATLAELLKGGPHAQARVKEVLRLNANHTFDELIEIMPRQLAEARSGDEAKEGFQAFFEKRKPAWMREE